jgi:diacylglycerol kinase (ATP)
MQKFSLKKRVKSFSYAFKGIFLALRSQHNMWIHTLALITVIAMGFLLKISTAEWIIVIIVSALVIALEIVNSAIELLVDFVSPEYNEKAGKIKDMAAGAVLIAAIAALTCGCIIFIPKMAALFI